MKEKCTCYVCKAHTKVREAVTESENPVIKEMIENLDFITEDLSTIIGMNEYEFSHTLQKPKVILNEQVSKNTENALTALEEALITEVNTVTMRVLNYYKKLISDLSARLKEQSEADIPQWEKWKNSQGNFFKDAYNIYLA